VPDLSQIIDFRLCIVIIMPLFIKHHSTKIHVGNKSSKSLQISHSLHTHPRLPVKKIPQMVAMVDGVDKLINFNSLLGI